MKKALLVSALVALVLPLAACSDSPDCGPKNSSMILKDATIVTAGFSFRTGGGFRPSIRPSYRAPSIPKTKTPTYKPAPSRPTTPSTTRPVDNGLGFWLPFWVLTTSHGNGSDCPAK